MIGYGLGCYGVALLCAVGFVASTVRADVRVHAVDPGSTSGLSGWPLLWLVAAVAAVDTGTVLLVVAVLR